MLAFSVTEIYNDDILNLLSLCLDQVNIPKLLSYKIRIDADKVDSTKRIEDRLTRSYFNKLIIKLSVVSDISDESRLY
jgi:hypothetical protein